MKLNEYRHHDLKHNKRGRCYKTSDMKYLAQFYFEFNLTISTGHSTKIRVCLVGQSAVGL